MTPLERAQAENTNLAKNLRQSKTDLALARKQVAEVVEARARDREHIKDLEQQLAEAKKVAASTPPAHPVVNQGPWLRAQLKVIRDVVRRGYVGSVADLIDAVLQVPPSVLPESWLERQARQPTPKPEKEDPS